MNRRSPIPHLVAVVLAVTACQFDQSVTAPALPDLVGTICNEEPVLCAPVDGTIHNGTGNGTLMVVPGDPAPGAPGVWLGHYVSRGYCYGDYNAFMIDSDQDWLEDNCEFQLARAFAPAVAMSPSDGCDKGEPYWAAKYFRNDVGFGDFVRIAYMPAYYWDCGFHGHAGDSEFIMVAVQFNPSTQHWEVRNAWLSAHAGEVTNSSDMVGGASLEYPARNLTYPRVWVSRSKHANYKSRDDCNQGAVSIPGILQTEYCDDNVTVGRLIVHPDRNVGSPRVDRFPNGVASANALYSQNGRREFFYGSSAALYGVPSAFKGWQLTGADPSSPYSDYLFSFAFECFLIAYEQCYYGYSGTLPQPNQTYLTAVIDGPLQVTAYQTYTWTSFVTGGVKPYRAEWWRQHASDASWTLVGTSVNEGQFDAGSWTGTVDRCETFYLKLKVFSADSQIWERVAGLSVTCPPPPLTVSIGGPGVITTKGTYAFPATVSGATSAPSYVWSERFCSDEGGTSCSGWVSVPNVGSTYTRTLGPDCSGTGQKNYQLHVVVGSGGRSASADHVANLCRGGGGYL